MARVVTIDISLTAKELRLVRNQVEQGSYASESEVIRDSLRRTFQSEGPSPVSSKKRAGQERLAAAYRATAAQDRKLAASWSHLDDAWPNT